MKTINLYEEAKSTIQTLLNDYEYGDNFDIKMNMTFNDLINIVMEYTNYQYHYSDYTSDLLKACTNDLNIFTAWQDIHKKYGSDEINPLLINEAILSVMLDQYGDSPLSYFNE